MPYRLPQVRLVFAVDLNGVIGKDNDIPWRSSQDFKWFRSITLGQNVIMGRKTWESLPVKPLQGRTNYVISRDPIYYRQVNNGAIVVSSVQEAIDRCLREDRNRLIYIIGGKGILEEGARFAERAFVSRVDIATPVDSSCIMQPDLPPYEVIESFTLFEGDEKSPSVKVLTLRFLG